MKTGLKWLKWLKWLKMVQNKNGPKKWLEIFENGYKWLKMVENG